jgi:hypothetical protein
MIQSTAQHSTAQTIMSVRSEDNAVSSGPGISRRCLEVPLLFMANAGTYAPLNAKKALDLQWPKDKGHTGKWMARTHKETGWCIVVEALVVLADEPIIRSFRANHPEFGSVVCDEDGTIFATTTKAYPEFLMSAHCVKTIDDAP